MVKTLTDAIENQEYLEEAIQEIEEGTSKEEELGLDKPFDPSEWISITSTERGIDSRSSLTTFEVKKSFQAICKIVREELNDFIVDSSEDISEKSQKILDEQHKAVIGDANAMNRFISRIMEVLRNRNITSNDYPNFYDNLAQAIFHEIWGVSILYKWEKTPDSEAAVIRGTELWIDYNGEFVRQPEQFESETAVERVKHAFTLRTRDAIINEQSPELEIEREDGTRITMIQRPRSRDNYVMFRRFTVQDLSLSEQANRDTIPERDIPLYSALSKTMLNIVFSGRVRSAKTTFMKSMIRERSDKYVAAVLEKHFELRLKEHFKNRLIFETQAKEGDLHTVIPYLLRMEHDYVVIGEIRSLEIEAFLQAMERGERGAYSTYHLTKEKTLVEQLSRHILDAFPNRNFENELARVADNIDLIITLSSDRDRRKKRVIGVTEIIWHEETRKHSIQPLVRYSPVSKKYYYSSNISKETLLLMAEESLEDAKTVMKILVERETESPMSEYDLIKDSIYEEIMVELGVL